MTRPIALLGLALLLTLQGALSKPTEAIIAEYGFCPKYMVKAADTLFEIAKALKVDQAELTAATTACGIDIALLQVGSEICLPGYNMDLCGDVVRTDPDRAFCQVYIVKEGDTPASVALKFEIKEEALVQLNSDYLDDGYTLPKAGQYVRIPGWNQATCRDFNDNDRNPCQMYTVQAQDTAMDIAQKYKVDLEETLALNGLNATAVLPLNFKLKLPQWNANCTAEGIPAELPSDTVGCRVTQLKSNENLALLAERYMTTLNAVLAVNPTLEANPTLLQPGTYVNLPAFGPECVGAGNLVDTPTGGSTTLPADFDYNGMAAGGTPAPTIPEVGPSPAPGPEAGGADGVLAPSPAPTPVSSPAAVPAPAPTPSSGASAAAASLVAAVLALLAGALVL